MNLLSLGLNAQTVENIVKYSNRNEPGLGTMVLYSDGNVAHTVTIDDPYCNVFSSEIVETIPYISTSGISRWGNYQYFDTNKWMIPIKTRYYISQQFIMFAQLKYATVQPITPVYRQLRICFNNITDNTQTILKVLADCTPAQTGSGGSTRKDLTIYNVFSFNTQWSSVSAKKDYGFSVEINLQENDIVRSLVFGIIQPSESY